MTLTDISATVAGPGLRERKRIATSRSIQYAVLELSRDRGLDSVTVDEISRRADVSPRTFFNYFPSKEAAVLGETPFTLASDVIDDFVAAGPEAPLFDGLLAIMISLSVAGTEDLELHQMRKAVIRDYPHLLVQRITSLREFEMQLTDVVNRRLTTDLRAGGSVAGLPALPAGQTHTDDAIRDRARLVTMVAVGTMRHAWGTWAESVDTSSLPDLLTRSFRDLHTLV